MAKKQTLQDFNVGVTLGTGSFGRGRFATDKETGQCYAVKILKKIEVVRLEQVEHINSEKTILEALDHPYIVKLSGTFQDQLNLYMVLEYIVGGEFFTPMSDGWGIASDGGDVVYATDSSTTLYELDAKSLTMRSKRTIQDAGNGAAWCPRADRWRCQQRLGVRGRWLGHGLVGHCSRRPCVGINW